MPGKRETALELALRLIAEKSNQAIKYHLAYGLENIKRFEASHDLLDIREIAEKALKGEPIHGQEETAVATAEEGKTAATEDIRLPQTLAQDPGSVVGAEAGKKDGQGTKEGNEEGQG